MKGKEDKRKKKEAAKDEWDRVQLHEEDEVSESNADASTAANWRLASKNVVNLTKMSR